MGQRTYSIGAQASHTLNGLHNSGVREGNSFVMYRQFDAGAEGGCIRIGKSSVAISYADNGKAQPEFMGRHSLSY